MLERIDQLVFYFTIECANCHNKLKVSHVSIDEQKGNLVCSLCAKPIKVPDQDKLIKAAADLNGYLGDKMNYKFFKLTMNEAFKAEDGTPAAAH